MPAEKKRVLWVKLLWKIRKKYLPRRKQKSAEEEAAEQWEKGYGLPVDEQEEKEAENDCKKMMELIFDIYKDADKGTASNVVLNDETVLEMQKRLMETGCPVSTLVTYFQYGKL